MAEITFILGGARSGKSRHAVQLAKGTGKKTVFIATAVAFDDEMKRRIAMHKTERPPDWVTIDEPKAVSSVVKSLGPEFGTVVIDCLTLLISNHLMEDQDEEVPRHCEEQSDEAIPSVRSREERFGWQENGGIERLENEIDDLLAVLKEKNAQVFIVSNEVGLGIVPENALARRFRDASGRVHQRLAKEADEVIFMVAGIPWRVK